MYEFTIRNHRKNNDFQRQMPVHFLKVYITDYGNCYSSAAGGR